MIRGRLRRNKGRDDNQGEDTEFHQGEDTDFLEIEPGRAPACVLLPGGCETSARRRGSSSGWWHSWPARCGCSPSPVPRACPRPGASALRCEAAGRGRPALAAGRAEGLRTPAARRPPPAGCRPRPDPSACLRRRRHCACDFAAAPCRALVGLASPSWTAFAHSLEAAASMTCSDAAVALCWTSGTGAAMSSSLPSTRRADGSRLTDPVSRRSTSSARTGRLLAGQHTDGDQIRDGGPGIAERHVPVTWLPERVPAG
jgi:hypothetical protein